MKIKLLALFGESSAGKDSIQHWLISTLKNTHEIISCTTRPKRDYETNGKEYHFISTDEYIKLLLTDKLLESSTFNNWFYGTPITSLDPNKLNIGIFNPEGIRNLISNEDIDVLPVWIQAPEKIRLLRSLKREVNPDCEEICRRFLADKKDFSNIDFDYEIFLNDNNNNEEYYGFLNIPKISTFIEGQS